MTPPVAAAALLDAAVSRPQAAPPPPAASVAFEQAMNKATATPMSTGEAAAALSKAYTATLGTPPSKATLAVLVSQWSLETGRGRAMMNYNFGGIKGQAPAGGSVSYLTTEGTGAASRSMVDAFRAYGTAAEGAADYLRLLHDRFPGALAQAQAGNAAGFAHALKREGYYTGSEKDYSQAIASGASRLLGGRTAATTLDEAALEGAGLGASAEGELGPAGVDLATFSNQLDLAALRIGMDRSDS